MGLAVGPARGSGRGAAAAHTAVRGVKLWPLQAVRVTWHSGICWGGGSGDTNALSCLHFGSWSRQQLPSLVPLALHREPSVTQAQRGSFILVLTLA